MQTRFVFVLFMVILLLAACGGSPEPAVQEGAARTTGADEVAGDSSDESAADPDAVSSDDSAGEEIDESDAGAEERLDESAGEEADTGAGESDEADGDTVAGRPASGTDSETGLAINPDVFVAGDEFIVRGTIISMNLTPTVSPEFLIEAPSGRKYRIRSQDLADTYFDDGAQLRPHEYRQGMLAQATVALPPGAGPADILRTENLTLLRDG